MKFVLKIDVSIKHTENYTKPGILFRHVFSDLKKIFNLLHGANVRDHRDFFLDACDSGGPFHWRAGHSRRGDAIALCILRTRSAFMETIFDLSQWPSPRRFRNLDRLSGTNHCAMY